MSQKEIVTKENLLICSVRWGGYNPESKNGFFPFEGQWIDSGLNYKVFYYERNLEMENMFTNNYGPMGEYIYYKIVLLSRSLTQFILREKFEPKYIVFCDYSDTLLISSPDDSVVKIGILAEIFLSIHSDAAVLSVPSGTFSNFTTRCACGNPRC